MTERRAPRLIENVDDLPPLPPDDDAPDAPPPPPAAQPRPPSLAARLFWGGLATLATMALGLWAWDVVDTLMTRNPWLGRVAAIAAALAAAGLVAVALRELAAIARLRRVDRLKEVAGRARRSADRTAAIGLAQALGGLYAGRAAVASGGYDEMIDADAVLDEAERRLAPLDVAAEAAVRRGARAVAVSTSAIPLPALDALATVALNLRMIREIALVYGGRAGWLGSWRLTRAVAAHLIAAGGLAAAEDLLGPLMGGGVLSKLSRKLGEGLANAALSARIGVAAIEVCRPMPFAARPRPRVGALLRAAVADLVPGGR